MDAFGEPMDYSSQLLNQSGFQMMSEDDILYNVPVKLVVLLSLFYGTISLLAVVGNTLVIWIVTTTRQMHTVTNFFIANLALADVTIGLFTVPFEFQAAVLQRWTLPEFMCPFCPFVQYVSVSVSVFTLTAIAIDRHRAILNPLKARPSKNTSKVVIAGIWAIALTLAAPISYSLRVQVVNQVLISENDTHVNISKAFCQNINLSESEMLVYRYMLVLVQYVIPFCIISFVYIQMAVKLWGSKTPGNAQDVRDITLLKNKKKVIKMLLVVVTLFGLCWLPLQTYNVLQVTWPIINEYKYINIIWLCCDWLAMSNSCYNPFIYGIYNEKFKREFFKRFACFQRLGYGQQFQPAATTMTDFNDKSAVSMYTRATSIHATATKLCRLPQGAHLHQNDLFNERQHLRDQFNPDSDNMLSKDCICPANPFIKGQRLVDVDDVEDDLE